MKIKTARRFLNRNRWKMADAESTKSPSFLKRILKCRKVLETKE